MNESELDVLLRAAKEEFGENNPKYNWFKEQIAQWQKTMYDGNEDINPGRDEETGLSELAKKISQSSEILTTSRSIVNTDDISIKLDISQTRYIGGCAEIPASIEIKQRIIQKGIKYSKKSKYRAIVTLATSTSLNATIFGNKKYVNKQCFFSSISNTIVPIYIKKIHFETSTSILNIDGKEIHMRGNSYSARIAALFFGRRWVISKVYQTDELYEKWGNGDWMGISKAERVRFRESLRQAERNLNDKVRRNGINLGSEENLIIGLDNKHYVNRRIVDGSAFNR